MMSTTILDTGKRFIKNKSSNVIKYWCNNYFTSTLKKYLFGSSLRKTIVFPAIVLPWVIISYANKYTIKKRQDDIILKKCQQWEKEFLEDKFYVIDGEIYRLHMYYSDGFKYKFKNQYETIKILDIKNRVFDSKPIKEDLEIRDAGLL